MNEDRMMELVNKLREACNGHTSKLVYGALLTCAVQVVMEESSTLEEAEAKFARLSYACCRDMALNWDTYKEWQKRECLQ